jgi:hypothetical protein
MEPATSLATRLSRASVKKLWDVYRDIPWPERLDDTLMPMSPELVSLYGTPVWDALDEAGRKKLALHDVASFFSITLHGERPLLQGLAGRMYVKHTPGEITDYLHHFLDEENKHMIMFAGVLHRYAGGVYPRRRSSWSASSRRARTTSSSSSR